MSTPTPEFVALVKSALEQLHDPVSLRIHPLAELLVGHLTCGPAREQALRQVLLDAVSSLQPAPSCLSANPSRQRIHRVLQIRYVDAHPYQEVMAELSLSQPQYHRYQRQALTALAQVLWDSTASNSAERAPTGQPGAPEKFPDDLSAIAREAGVVDLCEITGRAVALLRPAVLSTGLILRTELPIQPVLVYGNTVVARQLVFCLISYLLAIVRGGDVAMRVQRGDGHITLSITCEGDVVAAALKSPAARKLIAVARYLAESLSGFLTLTVHHGFRSVNLAVTLPLCSRSMLVIDDNPRSAQLIRSFVADLGYGVCAAADVPTGLALVRAVKPALVLLDVVMPGQDGWDALLTLKSDPATSHVPVVVCTVLGEPQVALALGADGFLEKPPTVAALLELLSRWAPGHDLAELPTAS